MNESLSYNEINEFLQNLPKNFNILEEQIDVDVQMAYFKQAQKQKRETLNTQEIQDLITQLNKTEKEEDVKQTLIKLANIDSVDAYRAIESFSKNTENNELRPWSILALQESRMLLESALLDEKQVFISTGMGGKGDKLRYFVVGFLESGDHFSNTQEDSLIKEFEYTLNEHNAEIESVEFQEKFALMHVLIPIKAPIKEIFTIAIKECKEIGIDLSEHFIVTNVKALKVDEIQTFLDEQLSNDIEEDYYE
jgi:hypothetical protein